VRQGFLIVLGFVIWALLPPTFASALVAYALAWLVVNATWRRKLSLPAKLALPLALVCVAVPASVLWARRDALLENEGLAGSLANSRDRAELERSPALFPGVVFGDHPQLFYIRAAGAEVALDVAGTRIPATSLGHDLFRVRYDPRTHGVPAADGDHEVTVHVGTTTHSRTLHAVLPRAHPRRFCQGDAVAVVSEETDTLHVDGAVIAVGDAPTDCVFSDGTFVVSHRHDDVHVYSADGTHLRALDLGPAHRLALHAGEAHTDARTTDATARHGSAQDRVAVALEDSVVLGVRRLPRRADELAFAGDTLVTTDTRDATLTLWSDPPITRRLGRPVVALAADHQRVVVATTGYHPGDEPLDANHFVQDQLLVFDHDLHMQDRVLTARRSARQGSAGDVDSGLSPMGLHLDGDDLWVAFAGSDELWLAGGCTPTGDGCRWRLHPDPRVTRLDGVLSAPHDVTRIGDILAVSSPADGRLALLSPTGIVDRVLALEPEDDALLRESELALARRMGERTFFEGTRAGIACQSCHLHADTDHQMRNIGERRLAPTLSVRGVAGTAPYLRDGSYPELGDLHHLADTLFRGFLREAPARAHTLEAYLCALPRPPSPGLHRERDLERERRGLDAFVRAGCDTCHAPPAFTNLGLHARATLFPALELPADAALDVPSLLTATPPYLTDGRATTLREVLDEDTGDRHGRTSLLDEDAKEDLVYFLANL